MVIKAKDFKSRGDLEVYIKDLKIPLTPEKKDHTIKGSNKELAILGLSKRCTFYGIECVSTDKEEKIIIKEKPPRGEIYKFGMNKYEK